MNCRELDSRLDDYFDGRSSPVERAAVEAHARACGPCRDAMTAEWSLREQLRNLPVPEPDMARLEATLSSLSEAERLQRHWRWLAGGSSIAASLVVAIALTLEMPPQVGASGEDLRLATSAPAAEPVALAATERPDDEPADRGTAASERTEGGGDVAANHATAKPEMPGLRVELNEVGELQLGLESRRSLEEAIFTVLLPEGVELNGYPGQREVSWVGRIEPGSNTVVLPLRAEEGKGGEITAHIAHIERQRSATVKMEVAPPP